jgi:hypothetical protein
MKSPERAESNQPGGVFTQPEFRRYGVITIFLFEIITSPGNSANFAEVQGSIDKLLIDSFIVLVYKTEQARVEPQRRHKQ